MGIAMTVGYQILIMFMLILVGCFLYRKKLVSDEGVDALSNILLILCTPAVVFDAILKYLSADTAKSFMLISGISVITIIASILIGMVMYGRKHPVEWFAVTFSNAGFIGVPLVKSILGTEALFYLSAFIVCANFFTWTAGVYMLTGKKEDMSVEKILRNPTVIAMLLGVILAFMPFTLPQVVLESIEIVGNLNTALAMFVLGAFIAKNDFSFIFNHIGTYLTCFYRLIVMPICLILLLGFVPNNMHVIKQTLLIALCGPSAIMSAIFPKQFGQDYTVGARIVSLSTILCIISIPFILFLSEIIWPFYA